MKLEELKKPGLLDTEDLPKALKPKAAEVLFAFSQCASFASALHSLIGGDLFCLYDHGLEGAGEPKPLHVYVRLEKGENYDVFGKRSTGQMALAFTGRISGMKAGKVESTNVPGLKKPTEKYIKMAKAYILKYPDKFDVPEKLRQI